MWQPQNFSDPFISENKIVPIIGSMVFKSTGSIPRFQCKNGFKKICTESRDIGQNVSNFAGLVWKADFWHLFGNILGLGAYFSKLISALKPWVQAGRFEYHEPYNLNDFFFTYKGVRSQFKLKRGQGRWHPIMKKFIFLKSTWKIHPGFTCDKIRKELFWFLVFWVKSKSQMPSL